MGFRFRRSISLIPGVRVNLSNGGASLSLGPRGASVSIGRYGTYANLGLPGTGLSYRTRIDGETSSRRISSNTLPVGTDEAELERQAAIINGDMEWVLNIHADTPSPEQGRTMSALLDSYIRSHKKAFSRPAPERPQKPELFPLPERPVQEKGNFLSRIFTSEQRQQDKYQERVLVWEDKVAQLERTNQFNMQRYQQARMFWSEQYAQWQSDAAAHAVKQAIPMNDLENLFATDQAFFEQVLSIDIEQLEWPRETTFTFEVDPVHSIVSLDVDLPEIEDIPPQTATLNARKTGLIIKNKSEKQKRLEYARHIHGCLLKIIGEVFASLPFDTVIIIGFTQRLHPYTGKITDDYILQCTVHRSQFVALNFTKMDQIDPVAALKRFELRRNMTTSGIFKTIELI